MRQDASDNSLLWTLEQLLAIEATSLEGALHDAAQPIALALRADKVDTFVLDAATDTLVSLGISDTPMGRRQVEIGMDRLQLANGGRVVDVFQSGESFIHGRADEDPRELRGIVDGLGVRSTIATPFNVGDERRGVLCVVSATPDFFTPADLRFIEAVARWVGMLAHRAELAEQLGGAALERGRQVAAEELITMLAHDLRNHITPLKGRVDLLGRRAERDSRARDAQDIAAASAAIARFEALIEDLLDVGRLESGMFAIDLRAVDVSELARAAAAGMQSSRVEIRVEAPGEAVACVDAARVRQALENLLSNAVKHAPEGSGVVVTVESTLSGAREEVVVHVRDQGPGIPAELLPRLFQRFATGPAVSGMGLGLYMASRIAAAHGGSLSVESWPGQGADFTLKLPVGDP